MRVKQKVHEGRMKNLSKNEEDLKVRIMSVWNDCKTNEEIKLICVSAVGCECKMDTQRNLSLVKTFEVFLFNFCLQYRNIMVL